MNKLEAVLLSETMAVRHAVLCQLVSLSCEFLLCQTGQTLGLDIEGLVVLGAGCYVHEFLGKHLVQE